LAQCQFPISYSHHQSVEQDSGNKKILIIGICGPWQLVNNYKIRLMKPLYGGFSFVVNQKLFHSIFIRSKVLIENGFQRKFAVTLKFSRKVIDRRIGKVKGRPVILMITFGESPPVTSCSVTFSPRNRHDCKITNRNEYFFMAIPFGHLKTNYIQMKGRN